MRQGPRTSTKDLLGIGALSRATGVPTDTLRTWERRYGVPKPERTPSGQRRYPARAVERLRQIVQAISFGHRASTVVPLDEPALARLLALTGPGSATVSEESAAVSERIGARFSERPLRGRVPQATGPPEAARTKANDRPDNALLAWFDATRRLDGRWLERAMHETWTAVGATYFIERFALPFVLGLGDRWQRGELSVRHEHFASECLRDLLSTEWRALSVTPSASPVVFATLPDELHDLTLHMAAVVLALAGFEVVFLGRSTPPREIADAVREHEAAAVIVAASSAADRPTTHTHLRELRDALDRSVLLAGGGRGLERPPGGVTYVENFAELVVRVRRHLARSGQRGEKG
jgi:MerR family transcriptional regulator, light-induced transcriptional regulator